MRINVTQEHIDKARREIPNRAPCFVCPIAQALLAAGCREVSVGQFEAYWYDPDGRENVFYLPEVVTDWIASFDQGLDVAPFSIDLGDFVDEDRDIEP